MKNYYETMGWNDETFTKVEQLYPRLLESVIPLSLTGVSPRNFYSWKENGLITLTQENDTDERQWVRFNLIEFVWVKAIQIMREYGFPYELIKQVKEELFTNAIREVYNNFEKYERINESVLVDLTKEELIAYNKTQREIYTEGMRMLENSELHENEVTIIYEAVTSAIIHNRQIAILIYKKEDSFRVTITTIGKQDYINTITAPIRLIPHFEIPINSLIATFFDEPKSDKYAEIFGFLNPKELKVLEAMQKKDFLELIIKLDKEKELVIDIVKDGNITDEKAAQVRKILGLNQYDEINIKYRNDKNLFFKNKKRIL